VFRYQSYKPYSEDIFFNIEFAVFFWHVFDDHRETSRFSSWYQKPCQCRFGCFVSFVMIFQPKYSLYAADLQFLWLVHQYWAGMVQTVSFILIEGTESNQSSDTQHRVTELFSGRFWINLWHRLCVVRVFLYSVRFYILPLAWAAWRTANAWYNKFG